MRKLVLVALGGAALVMTGSASASSSLSFSGYSWHVMNGTGARGQKWSASHTSVRNGILTIQLSNGVGGGVHLLGNSRTYGTYSVKMKMSAGGGKHVVLLWPDSGNRPEVDFAEGKPSDPSRKLMTGTWHPDLVANHEIHFKKPIDYTQWHTWGLIWRSTGLTWTLDGQAWAHTTATSHAPSHLNIQANYVSGTSSASATLQVAAVHVGP